MSGTISMEEERLLLAESDVINLILEFLQSRGMTTAQLELERESGVVNCTTKSQDLIFLRSLVVDGRWDDVIEFLQPLEEAFRTFPGKKVRATILKHRFLDMLSSNSTAHGHVNPSTTGNDDKSIVVEELVKVLNELEGYCDSKDEYNSLCLLLTSPTRLAEHPEYKDWKSSTARLACFTHLKPLVSRFIPPPSVSRVSRVSTNDRLIQLLIKGLLYETCVDFCQSKAMKNDNKSVGEPVSDFTLRFPSLLSDSTLSESDLSLLSWLRSIPSQTFGCPFQRRSLRVDVEPLPKPQRVLMNVSIMDSASDLLSRSMASTSFHLSSTEVQPDLKTMTTSVDRLFGDVVPPHTDSTTPFHKNLHQNQHHNNNSNSNLHPQNAQALNKSNPNHQPVTIVSNVNVVTSKFSNSQNQQQPPQVAKTNQNSNNISQNPSSGTGTLPSHHHQSQQQQQAQQSFDSNSTVEASEGGQQGGEQQQAKAKFLAVTTLEDVQAVRCAEFHPSGRVYAIGSNSKTLRICAYPDLAELTENHVAYQPTVLFKRTKHHKGSIYCCGWSSDGTLLATGSNDKTVKLLRFDDVTNPDLIGSQIQNEVELSMHDGTVRDVCFLEEANSKSSLLVSGGAGDCKIYVTDCATATPFQALSGHTGAILSLYNWGGPLFCSGSQDKSIRFWDLRTRGCVDVVSPLTSSAATKSAVASVCVESSGRLMITGHEDCAIVLYDIRGQRQIQSMKTHSADVRSVRFSPAAYYLLSGGYDNQLVLSDLQNDLSLPLSSIVVATHEDKVISGRWHPSEFSFLSTSADKTCSLWALPPEP